MSQQTTTTVPLPVTGVQQMDIFPAEGSLQTQQISNNLQLLQTNLAINKNDYLVDKIIIDNTKNPATYLFQMNVYDPYRGKATFEKKTNINLLIVPWSALQACFSSIGNFKVQYVLKPKKVHDCRVILDTLFIYNAADYTDPVTSNRFQNDGMTFEMDSTTDEIVITPPMYHMFDNFPLWNMWEMQPTTSTSRRPVFFPSTLSNLYIRSPYQPNALQPDSIEIQVWARITHFGNQKYATYGHVTQKWSSTIGLPHTEINPCYPFFLKQT